MSVAATVTQDLMAAYREGRATPLFADAPLVSATMDIHAIEISARCNLRCPMCDSMSHIERGGDMSLETFEKTLRYMSRKALRSTSLHTINEPLLSENLDAYLALLNHYRMRVSVLSTNVQLLHKRLDTLIAYADIIDGLRLSVEGATPAVYEALRFPGKFDRLVDNLKRLRQANAHEQFFPVSMGTTIMRANAGELAYHVQFYADYVQPGRIQFNLLNQVAPDGAFFEDQRIFSTVTPFAPCPMVFHNLYVLCNGDIAPCCRGKLPLGNIHREDPDLLVNDPRLIDIRRQHLAGRLDPALACNECLQVDPRIRQSFLNYHGVLLKHFWRGGHWDIDVVQPFYDSFFELYRDGIPEEAAYRDACERLLARPTRPRPRPAASAAPQPVRNVAVVGDSLSLPRGRTWGDVPLAATYPEIIRATLAKARTPVAFEVATFSRRSQTLTAIDRRIREFEERFPMDYVVIQAGIVDSCPRALSEAERANLDALPHEVRQQVLDYFSEHRAEHIASRPMICKTPLPVYRQTLAALLDHLAAGSTRAVFLLNVAPPSAGTAARTPGFVDNVAVYNAAIADIAAAWDGRPMAVRVVDVDGLVARHGAAVMLLADHQHLSVAANERIGRDIAAAILARETA